MLQNKQHQQQMRGQQNIGNHRMLTRNESGPPVVGATVATTATSTNSTPMQQQHQHQQHHRHHQPQTQPQHQHQHQNPHHNLNMNHSHANHHANQSHHHNQYHPVHNQHHNQNQSHNHSQNQNHNLNHSHNHNQNHNHNPNHNHNHNPNHNHNHNHNHNPNHPQHPTQQQQQHSQPHQHPHTHPHHPHHPHQQQSQSSNSNHIQQSQHPHTGHQAAQPISAPNAPLRMASVHQSHPTSHSQHPHAPQPVPHHASVPVGPVNITGPMPQAHPSQQPPHPVSGPNHLSPMHPVPTTAPHSQSHLHHQGPPHAMSMPMVVGGPPPPPHHLPMQPQHHVPLPHQQIPGQHPPQQTQPLSQQQNSAQMPQVPSNQPHLALQQQQHPMHHQPVIIPSFPYSPVMFPYQMTGIPGPYPVPGPMQPNPAVFHPQTQVIPNEIGNVQQFDPQSRGPPFNSGPGIPPPSLYTKPPTTSVSTAPPAPQLPPKTREKKIAAIVDPATNHQFTIDELRDSSEPINSQSSSSKDSGVTGISSNNPSISSDKDSSTDEAINTAATTPVTKSSIGVPSNETSPQSALGDGSTSRTIPELKMTDTSRDTPKDDQVLENGDNVSNSEKNKLSLTPKPVDESSKDKLCDAVSELKISNDKLESDDQIEKNGPTVSKVTPSFDLPYTAGQYSPLNPDGLKRYSIEFLKAVATEKLGIDLAPPINPRFDFSPHYMSPPTGYIPSQTISRRPSQQLTIKKKVIATHSLDQEPELKTVENPWKPELEADKAADPEMDTKRLIKVFRGHLNKLTPQKYDSLIEKIADLDLFGPERLSNVISLVFDKAVDEPGFCELYAKMCQVIAKKDSAFSHHLIKKCQQEFETDDLYHGLRVEERTIEIENETDSNKKKILMEELYEDKRLRRKRYLGTSKLIGEMYKYSLLTGEIIARCMTYLLMETTNESIECLCSLISTVGQKMAEEKDYQFKDHLRQTLNLMNNLANSRKAEENCILESRIIFKILDTVDLSRRNWRPRMVENNPKKIEEIREEAKQEMLRQPNYNFPNHNKGPLRPNDDCDRRRPNSSSYQKSHGWNK